MQGTHASTLRSYLARVVRDAIDSDGVPEDLARRAAAATIRNLAVEGLVDRGTRRRAEKYFWGVIRNSSLRSRDPRLRRIRERLLVATVARELSEAGYSHKEIEEEINTHYRYLRSEVA